LLDQKNILAPSIEPSREGVAEGMNGGRTLDLGLLNPLAEPALNMSLGEALTLSIPKERPVKSVFEVGTQVFLDCLAEKHLLGTAALGGPDMELAYVEVYVVHIQRDRRSQSDARGQHEAKEHVVATIRPGFTCFYSLHELGCLSLG